MPGMGVNMNSEAFGDVGKNNLKISYIKNFKAFPDEERVLVRLGYRKGVTEFDDRQIKIVREGLEEGTSLCRLEGAYAFVRMTGVSNDGNSAPAAEGIKLENGLVLKSTGLARLLGGSCEVLFMAATVGYEIADRIDLEMREGNPAKALILDSVASQTADAALDSMMILIGGLLAPSGRKLTKRRYSPGYGDLPLEWQKTIFDMLMLEKLNLKITDKFMLIPEKSVIAIAGVECAR